MNQKLKGISLAVIGGGAREYILAEQLAFEGAYVKLFGLPKKKDYLIECKSLNEAVNSVDALILPVPGMSDEYKVDSAFLDEPIYLSDEVFAGPPQNCPIFVGFARSRLKEVARKFGLRLIEVLEIDEVAIYNSIPSAEGAVQRAMEKMSITIHGSNSAVIGFGRTGITMARTLKALGANTTVLARKPEQLARAYEMGLNTLNISEIKNLGEVDVIFNTVPSLILTREVLESLPRDVLIIDLASAPGGTDFEAAKELGFEALLTPGLPGKVASRTAGLILAKVIPQLLVEELTLH